MCDDGDGYERSLKTEEYLERGISTATTPSPDGPNNRPASTVNPKFTADEQP
jgi:hypothetical protein